MDIKTTKELFKAALFTPRRNGRWGLPLLGEASPGVGKSAQVEEWSREFGLKPITLITSLRTAEDMAGFPYVAEDRSHFSFIDPMWVKEANEAENCVVFFDEMTAGASPRMFSAMLRIILDGVAGDKEIAKGARFVGMCNPPEQSPGGKALPMPNANRFGHFTWPAPDIDSWCDFMMDIPTEAEGVKPISCVAEQERVLKEWPKAWARASALYTSFIQRKPSLLNNPPDVDSPEASKAWPSPRSNDFAVHALASSFVHELSETTQLEFIAAFVGLGVASEFVHFMNNLDLPNPEDVLDGKVKFKHNSRKLDKTYVVLKECLGVLAQTPKKKLDDRAKVYFSILDEVSIEQPDLVVPLVKPLYKLKLVAKPYAMPVLERINPSLRGAGVGSK